MEKIEKIKIITEFITLGQFLKFTNLISNGSDAKYFIFNNEILVDGTRETRRGKKLYPNTKISINKKIFLIER